ncbi:MAG: hypothetical protein PHD97_00865 [Bacteroidales bacterium]|nr:hypothetical protein [Bacteroidales bacterium]
MAINFPSYNEIRNYVLCNFRLLYNYNEIGENALEQIYIKHYGDYEVKFNNIFITEPKYIKWKNISVPVFIYDENFKEEYSVDKKITFDIFLNSFLFLSGWQEWINRSKDKHNRFSYKNSLQYKFDFVKLPVVNVYFEILKEALQKNGTNIQNKKTNSQIILTHDVDSLNSGWLEDSGYYLNNFSFTSIIKIIKVLFNKLFLNKDSYFKALKTLIEFEIKHNLNSIYFFLSNKNPLDANYKLSNPKILKCAKQILENGSLVALHPGYDTFDNEYLFQKQLKLFNCLFPEMPAKKVRQHFLKYDVRITNKIQEKLNIEEDYSLGFAEQYGFRNGIANPFFLFGFDECRKSEIIEVPLFFMDGTLSHYMKENKDIQFEVIINHLDVLKNNFNFCFSVLFHNTAFSELKYKGFSSYYEKLIEWARGNNVSLDTKI